MSDQVGNPEDRFSRVEAHVLLVGNVREDQTVAIILASRVSRKPVF